MKENQGLTLRQEVGLVPDYLGCVVTDGDNGIIENTTSFV